MNNKQRFFFFMFSWQTPIYAIGLIGICVNSILVICMALAWTLLYPMIFEIIKDLK